MITVSIRLTGPLSKFYTSDKRVRQEKAVVSAEATVAELLDQYGISHGRAHILIVNRQKAELTTRLKEGDKVWILPLAHGG
jgi:molybdopterin converting factor small subunit